MYVRTCAHARACVCVLVLVLVLVCACACVHARMCAWPGVSRNVPSYRYGNITLSIR